MARVTSLALLIVGLFTMVEAKRDAYICGANGYAGTGDSQNLTYDSNAWNPVDDGFQCMAIINTPPSFDATGFWVENATTVHSYPYVRFPSSELLVALNNISSLTLSAQWGMASGNDSVSTGKIDSSGLNKLDTVANVAFDMFADPDPSKAVDATQAAYEIMIWIGLVGNAQPIGDGETGTCNKQKLGGTEYTLYQGKNYRGTSTFSWVAESNVTDFKEDVSPLFQYLWRNGLVSSDSSLGLIEFGSEAYHATANVTFSASGFDLNLESGTPPKLDLEAYSKKCSSKSSGASAVAHNPAAFIVIILASFLVL